jgi:capsular exopolysaccharide synthesis family protein
VDAFALEELFRRGAEVFLKRRWWFLFSAAIVLSASIVWTNNQQLWYRATSTITIDTTPPKVLSEVSEVVTLGSSGFLGSRIYFQAQQRILQSRSVAADVVTSLQLARREKFLGIDDKLPKAKREALIAAADPIGQLASRVLVEMGEDTMIATVSIEDKDPEFAKELVNAVAEAYKNRNVNQKRSILEEATKELVAIHGQLEKKKLASQTRLSDFEKKHDLSKNRSEVVNERLLALNRDVRDVHSVRVRAQQEVAQLKKFRGSRDIFSASAPAVMRDGLVGQLKERYLELAIRKQELDATYLERHPKVESIQQQMEQLVSLGSKHVSAMYESASQSLAAAQAQEADLQTQIQAAKNEDAEIRLTKIEHDQLIAQADEDKMFYDKVAKRLAEADLTKKIGVNNVSILDRAITPQAPSRPNKRLNFAIGLVLSLLIGIGVALMVDLLDNTVKDRLDVEGVLGVPYLGAIPTFSPTELNEGLPIPDGRLDLYAYFRPNSRVAEAARSVRTNLLFMRPDKPLHTLVITSAHPREGKTSTSTTLAITLAASTGNCVVVDTDLRKPRLHHVFGVPGDVGVTSYILSQEPVEKFIKKTDVPGLSLMACGPVPPNPSEILHTERFRQLVTELMAKYDTVVFDSPPVEIVSDALVIASLVDGVVLVGHSERSKRESMKSTIHALQSVNAELLGVVLSRTATRGAGYGYYYGKGYRRGVAYRYRYATDPDPKTVAALQAAATRPTTSEPRPDDAA